MFYTDEERGIFTPEGSDRKYDPLAVLRRLTAATKGEFNELWIKWCSPQNNDGDVSVTQASKEYESACAEEQLVKASRVAFELPDFPDCTDGVALSHLRTFVEYLQGKDSVAGTPQDVQESSPVA